MKLLLPFLAGTASAFPAVLESLTRSEARGDLMNFRRSPIMKRADNATQAISQAQTNCGPLPCLIFSEEEQFVSTSGEHAWVAPGAGDIRGPCPGLNAAANHGYLPHNGILHIEDTHDGLVQAFGMDPTQARFLAVFSIVMTGDPLTLRWSIGGPLPGATPLSPGQGIGRSHNKYEGDASIGRFDAYLNDGKPFVLDVNKFRQAYEFGMVEDRYNLDNFRQLFARVQAQSIAQNAHFFSPPFAGAAVAPAAYNFAVNFMSNHSAEEPSGYFDGEMFKSFWAITGDYPNFVWTPGHERIPDNWYRRTSTNRYTLGNLVEDVVIGYAAYPGMLRIGGNTNGVNTFRGVDLEGLTGGQYSLDGLLEGNNFACLVFQTQLVAIPDFAKGLVDLGLVQSLLSQFALPALAQFSCPELAQYDKTQYNDFPGATELQ